MSDCIDTTTPEWKELLAIVKGNTEDAVEVWESLKGRTPETDYEKEYVRKFYSMARSLRKKTDDQLADFLKGVTPEFDYWNGRLMLQKHHEIDARNFIKDINRRVRYERVTVQETKKFRKGGNKAYYAKINGRGFFNEKVKYQKTTPPSSEEFVASEKTIRDLAARMSDRIGVPIKFESDRTKDYKGKIEGNIAYINLAYATLDTPIHEILGHPIIRAIKNRKNTFQFNEYTDENGFRTSTGEFISGLYNNLLKELEYGKGKEVLDRVKRDYRYKGSKLDSDSQVQERDGKYYFYDDLGGLNEIEELEISKEKYEQLLKGDRYTLEEQQEEAIVELLGLMTADRLDKVKDGKLISLLKRLLKEMKAFMRSLIGQKEVEIDKLPDNMTLGDIADLLAYSNSKLILPGNEVIYTTPDNQQFKTYQEANRHVSALAKNTVNVNLSTIKINLPVIDIDIKEIPEGFDVVPTGDASPFYVLKKGNEWFANWDKESAYQEGKKISEETVKKYYIETKNLNPVKDFIEKNKEYEQSKEIIEEWKKVNNIQYNPEEIYSRGQEFVSVVGAYSDFDVDLMMQNLLQHIEDNEKAGGKFAISSFTKPVDKTIGHLEGGGSKIKFKIYPQSQDILWAANTDVYSGSVWDASEKVSKDKKSELLGVSYTKYPSLRSINSVQPNLASIVDDLSHHHNELGIELTTNNFRIEYDNDIPYQTKKIIDKVNKILDDKYGKIKKPEIKIQDSDYDSFTIFANGFEQGVAFKDANSESGYSYKDLNGNIKPLTQSQVEKYKPKGKQPTQTRENTTSIESVEDVITKINNIEKYEKEYQEFASKKEKILRFRPENYDSSFDQEYFAKSVEEAKTKDWWAEDYYQIEDFTEEFNRIRNTKAVKMKQDLEKYKQDYKTLTGKDYTNRPKEYTSQAEINTKIARLKEVARRYPRSLIRSEVRKINDQKVLEELFGFDELPFQKISQEYIPPDPKIEARLKSIMADLGIRLESYDEYAEWYEETYYKPLNAVAVADMYRKVIAVKEGKADRNTLPEELSHFILYALRDNKQVVEALSLVEGTEEWKLHSEAYISDYNGDMEAVRLEILGKMMAKQLGDTLLNERPIWKQRLERLWKTFLKFFTFGNMAKENRIKENLDSIVNDVLSGNLSEVKKGLEGSKGVFKQIDPEMFKNSKILNKHKKELQELRSIILRKVNNIEKQGIKGFAEKEKKLLKDLTIAYNKNRITEGLINFINHAETEAEGILSRIEGFENTFINIHDAELKEFVVLLRDMNAYISTYGDIVSAILESTRKEFSLAKKSGENTEGLQQLLDALRTINEGITSMNTNYEEYGKIAFVSALRKFVAKRFQTPEEVEAEMDRLLELTEKADKDVNFMRRWLDSAAESQDDIIMLVDRMYKEQLELSNLETDDTAKDLIDKDQKVRNAGYTNDFVVERDSEGNVTGNFVTEVNEAQWEKDLFKFFKELRNDFGLIQDPEIDLIKSRILDLKNIRTNIENGSKRPYIAENSNTKVSNSSEYFGESVTYAYKGSKQKTLEFLDNQIKYLEKEGERSYTKKEASNLRKIEREKWHPKQLHEYNTRIAIWMNENTEENPKWKELLEKKRKSVYDQIFLFKKDLDVVDRYKKDHGDKWLTELKKTNKDLYRKGVRAEEIILEWKNERYVQNGDSVSFRKNFARPKMSKYRNPQYDAIMKDPIKKEYYEFVMDLRKKLTTHMGEKYADSILLPQIRKDWMERMKQDPEKTLTEGVRDALKRREDETDFGALDENDRPIDQVPMFFFNRLDNMNDLSLDITASMIMFADMANRHRHISNIIDIAEVGKDIMRTRKVIKKKVDLKTLKREQIVAEGGNAYERYEAMMKMNFYGQGKKDEGDIWGIDKAKVADLLNRYTSLNSLALNVYAGFQNVILGNILIRQEAFVNEFVDHKDVLYADKKYWGDINGLLADVGKVKSDNKLRLFLERTDALQDFENRTAEVNTERSRWGRMFNMSSLFFVNHAGEHQMQGRMAIALAHRQKVLNKEGKEIPMYEAFYVEDGRLKIAEGTKNLDGSIFTNEDLASFNIRMKAINQRLHGIYNNTDKAALQQYAIGRMVSLFRKWMKPGFNRRFDTKYYNYSLGSEVEGSYMTVFNFFKVLKNELQEGKLSIATAKDKYSNLSPMEQANMRRALAEVTSLLGALLATLLLDVLAEGLDDDDDEVTKWAVNMAAYQANRLVTEVGVYFPLTAPSEALKIAKSPAAAINSLDQVLSLGRAVDPIAFFTSDDVFPRYERGRNKGQLKIAVWGKKTIPIVDTVEDWFYPEDRLKFFTQ